MTSCMSGSFLRRNILVGEWENKLEREREQRERIDNKLKFNFAQTKF